MSNYIPLGVEKRHPATRELLPDDPLELQGRELPGDTALMLTMMVEEMARMGWNEEHILGLVRDPFYQSLHGLWHIYGEAALRREVRAVLSRVGVSRVHVVVAPTNDELVQIQLDPLNTRGVEHG